MNISEHDWKLFCRLLPLWQERYMEGLVKEYMEILASDEKLASEKYWTLEKRIENDKYSPGVLVKNKSRSKAYMILLSLIRDGVITEEDLKDFDDDFRAQLFKFV